MVGELADQLSATIEDTVSTMNSELEAKETELIDVLVQVARVTESRITAAAGFAEAAGVNSTVCVNSSLGSIEAFRTRMTQRTERCIILTSNTLTFIVDESWTEALSLQGDTLACHAIALAQCQNFGDSSDCYDFFITNIERARENLKTNFALVTANFINRITGVRLPCRDIIDFQTVNYPNFLVNAVSSCLNFDIRTNLPVTCNMNLE